jgi:hypothetical protein
MFTQSCVVLAEVGEVIPEFCGSGHGQEDLASPSISCDLRNLDELATTILK